MKKLKNINFKALFVDHGEKFGFGLIAVLVLLALGSTSWSRYEKTPEELKRKVDDARARITSPSNVWPQAKADAFKVVDFNDRARQVFTSMDISKHEYSTPLYHPLYRKRELAREPEYLPVQYLIASAGRAILSVTKPQASTGVTGTSTEGAAATDVVAAPTTGFRLPGQPTAGATAGAAGTTTPFSGSAHNGAGPTAAPPRPVGGASALSGEHGAAAGMEMMMAAGGDGGTGMAAGATPEGARYVAIRGVFPLRQQLESYQRKLNVSAADASTMFELLDFVLERQAALAGSDPWAGKWEEVNIQSAVDVLQKCADFDPDPVQTGVTDAVITMSLPSRLLEYWGDDATHPNIRDFQLKPEEMERELKLQQKLVEEYEKSQLQNQSARPERRGLSGGQRDLRQMGNDMMNSSYGNEFMRDVNSFMAESGGPRMAPPDIRQRLTANGRLLLFRYFDFDVAPGMAYRYRVKLKIRNPNFERPVEEVADPALVQGPERETEWSNITNPAVVPTSVNYFLKDVERDPVRDDKSRSKPVANITMFEWSSDLGTMLSDSLKILSVGQFISEKKPKSIVINVGIPSYEEKEVAFLTEDVLVDAVGDFDVAPELHPDLGLRPEKGRKDVRVGLVPEALVMTGLGEMKQLDPVSEKAKETALKQRVDAERKSFEKFKDAENQTGSALDGSDPYAAMMGLSGGGGSHGEKPGGSSKKNAKKMGGSHGEAPGGESGTTKGRRSPRAAAAP